MAEGNKVFPKGIRVFDKHEKAPDFVLGTVIISKKEIIDWLNGEAGQYMKPYKDDTQIKLQLTKDRSGKPMLSVDTYGFGDNGTPQNQEQSYSAPVDNGNGGGAPPFDDLPF